MIKGKGKGENKRQGRKRKITGKTKNQEFTDRKTYRERDKYI